MRLLYLLKKEITCYLVPELAQDVSAFHNIDAEAELTAMLSEQAAEIDREILRDIRAAWQLRWDYNGWRKAATSANPYTQKNGTKLNY
jgi:hypothetical protein